MVEDVNAILHRARCCAAAVIRCHPYDPTVSDLVQAFEELDKHLCDGGVPPGELVNALRLI